MSKLIADISYKFPRTLPRKGGSRAAAERKIARDLGIPREELHYQYSAHGCGEYSIQVFDEREVKS